MILYDDVISSWLSTVSAFNPKELKVDLNESWKDAGKANFILPQDSAFELGGKTGTLSAIGGTAVTSNKEFVSRDQILLLGKDLCDLKNDSPYARLSVCLVDDSELGEGSELFNTVKAIDYTRYHFNPEGFMMRVSSAQKREAVRISKAAVKNHISFRNAGNLMIKAFHKNPKVKAVKIIYIVEPDFDYTAIAESVKQCDLITKTIDHISQTAIMECSSCGLQKVCDEVEGMRELHFKNRE